ncbi:elongator complex protein 1 [Episyrphus balteatus]|uniref:elongator complex protein 1 n=1 Tax=Episyrphus balteatus TaxID=286459 RepID=UPI002485511D|nr:elongator complex protein 1 [Episyrphus balteatus]
MKNLKLKYIKSFNTKLANPKFIVLDSSGVKKNTIFLCTETELFSCNLQNEVFDLITDATGVISCEYLSLENQICIATETGEVLLINPETKSSTEVTFCDGGIEKMVWSPDQEVVAFVTTARNVVVMTCTFDPISEVKLDDSVFGENEFITVGWGKKETQFHGSEGKTAAKQKTDFSVPDNIKELPQDIDITWREDGQFFAVTFVGPHGRMFKVFDKEGALKFTSEKMNDLWPAIAWRPSGTWIAVPHKFPNKSTIALFEKNGLRHREIVLPFQFDVEPVVNLKWNSGSDILAIETRLGGKSVVYLYTIGNYHWYLKQTLRFESTLSAFVWDNRIGEEKTMHVILENGTFAQYSWNYKIDSNQKELENLTVDDRALVAVIDGKRLLITDFRKGIVPPPMSSLEFLCEDYINQCVFLSEPNLKDGIICFLISNAQNDVLLYSLSSSNDIKPCDKFTLPPSNVPLSRHNLIWPCLSDIHFVQNIGAKSKIGLLETFKNTETIVKEVNETICGLEILDKNHILAHSISGKILKISTLRNASEAKIFCDPGQLCDKIEYFKRNTVNGVVSLDIHQCLRFNSKTLSTDVTSFHITENYLVFTQLTVMKFMTLSDWKIINERKIERGAKIVIILPHGSLTILQLPRGNLEAIHPRVLCLEMVGDLLDRKQYHLAMDLVRKQRINLNIICDHDVSQFLLHLKDFLKQIKPQWLNLFLTDLQNEDFTLTMYSSNYSNSARKYPENFRIENKVAYICDALCKEMCAEGLNHFLLPIITAHVKIGNIEKALEIIWEERKKEGDVSADDALKYLLYLVDVNQLYDVALGMYDFGLVLMVAKRSQKDPREFLPFLNELKVLEENYRKFKIDFHLKRFAKALCHISLCGDERFEEALGLVKTHNLYRDALSAYRGNTICYKKIAQAYGDYLRENGKFENASIMYERAGLLNQAVTCARHILDWQRCLALTKIEGIFPQEVAMSLVPSLMEHGRHEEAYELLKKYGNNFSEGISCLMKGNLYLRAIFESKIENADLLNTIIIPDLLSYKETLASNLNADKDLFLKQKSRLLYIREKKSKENTSDDLDDSGQIDESDLLSDTTSMHSSRYTASSRGTGKTFRSSKNRRKHERKLLSLKEGNPFEDIALIDALHNHIIKVYEQQAHVRDTCKALLEVFEDDHARQIQSQYRALLILLKDSFDEIWIPEVMTTAQYITGPNIDYAALQNEQRYAMINPLKRFKPEPKIIDWQHEVLR